MAIEVLRRTLFAHNARAAEENRAMLDEHRVVAVNVMGGAGCGKTTLLERMIPLLRPNVRLAVLEGDIATTRDAARIAALDVPVIQLLTEGGCHLTAALVQQGIARLRLDELDLLIIENVGNPICPANFDLGEHHRVAILSASEGDDKPSKYPYLFQRADLVVFTKMDLQPATNFQPDSAARDIRLLDAGKTIIETSAVRGGSVQLVADWVAARCHCGVASRGERSLHDHVAATAIRSSGA